jgi:hypothetical protein
VLWVAAVAAHLGYDALVAHGHGDRGPGSATVVLYLAISPGFQRVIVQQRARRLQPGGPAAFGHIERPAEQKAPGSSTGQGPPHRPGTGSAWRMISSGCRACRPVPCPICCRQETPVAAMIVSSGSARMAGKSRSPPMRMDS